MSGPTHAIAYHDPIRRRDGRWLCVANVTLSFSDGSMSDVWMGTGTGVTPKEAREACEAQIAAELLKIEDL